ncbi:hypothetical protein [Noviherbaspirillum galbum]|uniref:Uncharacterized protein n=1 Tax=Noviherbaspirillum galbum TaxID=2709383 RepID=A0A6B3SK22_9BURK|nr:hypothetical protein [Noviherbaspirillum galbum]NEX61080.1 hypothetical protein [Noviherbaspirillum galbum]
MIGMHFRPALGYPFLFDWFCSMLRRLLVGARRNAMRFHAVTSSGDVLRLRKVEAIKVPIIKRQDTSRFPGGSVKSLD